MAVGGNGHTPGGGGLSEAGRTRYMTLQWLSWLLLMFDKAMADVEDKNVLGLRSEGVTPLAKLSVSEESNFTMDVSLRCMSLDNWKKKWVNTWIFEI